MNTLLVGGIEYQQLEQGQTSDSIITSTPFISFINNSFLVDTSGVEAMFFYESKSTNIQYNTPNMLPASADRNRNSYFIKQCHLCIWHILVKTSGR